MRRITKLEHDLKDLRHARGTLQRKSRSRSGLGAVTIVGYTNAGKSTLLNRLTDAGVLVEDRLFATLDPTTRRLSLPGGEPVLLTDTVGFVRKLPHGLVEAFKTHARGRSAEADCSSTSSTLGAPIPRARSTRCATVLRRDRRRPGARAAGVQQGRHRPDDGRTSWSSRTRGSVAISRP